MRLEIGNFPVTKVVFGSRTAWSDGILEIDPDAILREIRSDPMIATAQLDLAEPGESVRIWPVRDVITPMLKVDGPGMVYPGMSGRPMGMVGQGRTHKLGDVAVVEVSSVNWHESGGDFVFLYLDMTGPWGDLMPYRSLFNVCAVVEPAPDLPIHIKNRAVHQAALTVADRLAEATRELAPPELEAFELGPVDASLPKVVYLQGLHSPQAMSGTSETFGNSTYGLGYLTPPWLLHPNEILDGATSGPYRTAFATSWTVTNNPVLLELYRRHGADLNLLGVIILRTEWTTMSEKELVASQTAKLAKMLGADGAIVTWDAGGNEFIEVIRSVKACEALGIKTVFLTGEDASRGGAPTMLEPAPEADAIVSTGFFDSTVQGLPDVPEVERVIGLRTKVGRLLNAGGGIDPREGSLEEQTVPTASSLPPPPRYDDHYGFNRLSAIEY